LHRLAESWHRERLYQEGVLAVIAGRPNAGKSSLFNLLLKEERSIVTDIPGTTRDWIEAWVSIGGIPVRLADTAGLRTSLDPVEAMGVERSRGLLESAELVLYLIDGTEGITDEDAAIVGELRHAGRQKPCIPLWNKADVVPVPSRRETALGQLLGISAKTGEGMADLTAAIALAVAGQTETADAQGCLPAAVGTVRQKNLVEAAAAALEEALALAERQEPLDLIAPMLREAVNLLGEITGEVSTADILEEMFGKFCVGK
ncbi:MAG: 50S ribosome-binding GTPase, partial [Treponema sp.]|nr:50S ribosome-binding GTPase [Treponema sp.]